MRRLFPPLLFAVLALRSAALPADAPRFAQDTSLPSLGLSFSGLLGAAQKPLMPPEVRRWHYRRGPEEWEEERSDATELWRAAQVAGTWEDRRGNVLVLARALALLPPALAAQGDVTRETFDRAFEAPENALGPAAGGDELGLWLERFAGVPLGGEPQLLPLHPARFARIWEFPLSDPAARAWAFRVNTSHAGSQKAPREWFAFVLRLASEPRPSDVREIDRMLRSDLLGSVRALSPSAAAREAERNAKRRPRTPVEGEGEPAEDAARLQARASVEALDEWWTMDSGHYILLSDNPAAEREADALLSGLERLRPRFAALVPPLPETIPGTAVVRLFRRSEDFDAYLEDTATELGLANTAGYFDGNRRELVIRPADRRSAQDLGSVVRHEAFHQYFFHAWSGVRASPWFNEGYADFFACYRPRGRGFEWAETKWQADLLQRLAARKDFDWTAALRAILLWDQASFYAPPGGGDASTSYALAWGLVYFLERGAPSVRNKPYRNVLPDYLRALREHAGARGCETAATLEAFRLGPRGEDTEFLDRLAKDLRTFFLSDSARRNARSAPIP